MERKKAEKELTVSGVLIPSAWDEKFNVVALGLILMVVMLFFPEGLIPGILSFIRKKRAPKVVSEHLLRPAARR